MLLTSLVRVDEEYRSLLALQAVARRTHLPLVLRANVGPVDEVADDVGGFNTTPPTRLDGLCLGSHLLLVDKANVLES